MAAFLTDNFTAPDGTSLTAYNPGWNIVGTSGFSGILGGRVRQTGSSTSVYVRSDVPSPSADYSVSADLYVVAASGAPSVGVTGRGSTTAQTFYQARATMGSGIVLVKFSNGAATTMGTYSYPITQGATIPIKLKMQGTTISVFINNETAPVIEVTDGSITEAGFVGIRLASANTNQIHLDNLVAETLGGGVVEYTYSPSGGLSITGSSTVGRSVMEAVAGGMQLAGTAIVSAGVGSQQRAVVAVGGLVLGGAGMLLKASRWLSTGGLKLSGQGRVDVPGGSVVALLGALNDVIKERLGMAGKTGARNDMLQENKYWRGLGETAGILSLNDVKKKVLSDKGLEGALNDKEKKYWSE